MKPENTSPEIKAGQQYVIGKFEEPIRVMAIVENYVMWRRKGCVPALHTLKDFKKFLASEQAILLPN